MIGPARGVCAPSQRRRCRVRAAQERRRPECRPSLPPRASLGGRGPRFGAVFWLDATPCVCRRLKEKGGLQGNPRETGWPWLGGQEAAVTKQVQPQLESGGYGTVSESPCLGGGGEGVAPSALQPWACPPPACCLI